VAKDVCPDVAVKLSLVCVACGTGCVPMYPDIF
jgi:hypothetical protein